MARRGRCHRERPIVRTRIPRTHFNRADAGTNPTTPKPQATGEDMLKPSLKTISIGLAIGMLAASCSSDSSEEPTTTQAQQGATTTVGGQMEPIRVGTLLSVTGPLANLGDKMQQGMQLAVDQINDAGGIDGRPIEWIMYDPAGDASTAIDQTRRLITSDQVDVIVGGGTSSGIALGMADITEEAGIVFMATEGARQIVSPIEDRQLTFKSTFNDTEIIERTIEFWQDRGITRVAFLPDTTGFGTSALEVIEELAPPAGIELFVESFDPSTTDLTPQLSRLAANNPQTFFAWTATPAGVVFLKNASELGLQDDALLQNGFGFVDSRYMVQAEDASVGSLLTAGKLPVYDQLPGGDAQKEALTKFHDAFVDAFGEAPNVFATQTYDGMMLVAEAIRRAGTTEGTAVAKALESITDFVGLNGVYNFSADRHAGLQASDAVVFEWNGERFSLVWPSL
ncbi:MAG: ABC transporter substrate-binding protein [Acidimicrobiia bacterium]